MEKAFPILETERLILREATEEDAKDMFVYLSDQLVIKHMGISACETPEEVLGEIEWYKSIYKNGTGMRWGITLKDSGKVIGSCGFLNRNPKHYRCEVGYELSREHWGKGIANEALERVLQFGFEHLELERIEALIEPKIFRPRSWLKGRASQEKDCLGIMNILTGNLMICICTPF